MSLVIVGQKLSFLDIKKAREEYKNYIKITVDLEKRIVIIGGEYHADAEALLQEKYKSLKGDIWGGGYNIETEKFETNAIINLKPATNNSMEIIDPDVREDFLNLVKSKLLGIKSLL